MEMNCPYCRDVTSDINRLLPDNPGETREIGCLCGARMHVDYRGTLVKTDPPSANPPTSLESLKEHRNMLIDAAEKAAHAYACECEVGPERIQAFEVFEHIRSSRRQFR